MIAYEIPFTPQVYKTSHVDKYDPTILSMTNSTYNWEDHR
jgi:hypothetical protein